MSLLSIESLSVVRGPGKTLHYPDISLETGGQTLLMGPSGCGKSTLLSAIAGLLPPASGKIMFDGNDLYALPSRARDRLRGGKIGFVFQNLHLVPSLSLRRNIQLAPSMAELPHDQERLNTVLSALGLTDLQEKFPDSLSQGEKQRAAIARAIINKPALIIADEPTSALDDENAVSVVQLLQSCARESGVALLIATHDRRLQDFVPRIIPLARQEEVVAA